MTENKGVRFAAVSLAVVVVHCADPAAPRLVDLEQPSLDLRSAAVWTANILPVARTVAGSSASDVNDAGVVVGNVSVLGRPGVHAVRWTNGVMSFLGEPKGLSPVTIVERVNNAGIAVGNYHPGFGENRAVRWDAAGAPMVLVGLPGGSSDVALDVNDAGIIVGHSQHRAVRWIGGVVQDLHPPAYEESSALGINGAGDIVGWVKYPIGTRRAYLWPASGKPGELGALSGDAHSGATAVNAALTVVGNSGDLVSMSRAFVWKAPIGIKPANLAAPSTYATRVRARAHGVNSCGDIAGVVENLTGSVRQAVLWTKSDCDVARTR